MRGDTPLVLGPRHHNAPPRTCGLVTDYAAHAWYSSSAQSATARIGGIGIAGHNTIQIRMPPRLRHITPRASVWRTRRSSYSSRKRSTSGLIAASHVMSKVLAARCSYAGRAFGARSTPYQSTAARNASCAARTIRSSSSRVRATRTIARPRSSQRTPTAPSYARR